MNYLAEKAAAVSLIPTALLVIGIDHWFPRLACVIWLCLSVFIFGAAVSEAHNLNPEDD